MNASIQKLEKRLKAIRELSWRNFGKKIEFYIPSFINYETLYFISRPHSFPSISITGKFCAQKCKHCNGKILNTMIQAPTPEKLIDICEELKAKGCLGCLISGGCLQNRSVPIEKFATTIGKVKQELGLMVVVHTGIVNHATAKKLKKAQVDAALLDVIGSDKTINEICQIKASVRDYEQSMKVLQEYQVPFVPHILVGLHYGKIKGEFRAIEIISKYQPAAVIVIAFMPMIGTQMERNEPPPPEDIARILTSARLMLPNTPLVLGCARPLGEHRIITDMLAVKAGVNAIAFPSEEAVRLARTMGLETSFYPICCSQIACAKI